MLGRLTPSEEALPHRRGKEARWIRDRQVRIRRSSRFSPWSGPQQPAPLAFLAEHSGVELGGGSGTHQHLARVGGTLHCRRLGGWGTRDHELAMALSHEVKVETAAMHPDRHAEAHPPN